MREKQQITQQRNDQFLALFRQGCTLEEIGKKFNLNKDNNNRVQHGIQEALSRAEYQSILDSNVRARKQDSWRDEALALFRGGKRYSEIAKLLGKTDGEVRAKLKALLGPAEMSAQANRNKIARV